MIDLKRLRRQRWLCSACEAEGAGSVPDACPFCGSTDSWFAAAGDGSTESLLDRWHRVWDELLRTPGTLH